MAFLQKKLQRYYESENTGGLSRGMPGRGASRTMGGRSKSSGRKRVSTSSRKHASGGSLSGIELTTQDYMLGYGNPFTTVDKYKVGLPRIPDPAFSGASAATMFTLKETVAMPTTYTQLVASSRMGGMQGTAMCGAEQRAISAPIESGAFQQSVVQLYIRRIAQNLTDYSRYSTTGNQQQQARYVCSAMKVHDLGAEQNYQGQLSATHLNEDFIPNLVRGLTDLGVGDADSINAQRAYYAYGLMGVFSGCGGMATDDPMNVNFDVCQGVISNAAQGSQVPQGERLEEFTAAMGCTIKTYTSGTSRPFADLPPPVVFGPEIDAASLQQTTAAGNQRYINQYMTSVGYDSGAFWDDIIFPVISFAAGLNQLDPLAPGADYEYIWTVAIQSPKLRFIQLQVRNPAGATPARVCFFLCESHGIPVSCLQSPKYLGLDGQGDAPFMYIRIDGFAVDRPLALYYNGIEEYVPALGSIVIPTPGPIDNSWDEICKITNQFPRITKGFTFMKSLVHGIGSAVKFITKNKSTLVGLARAMF